MRSMAARRGAAWGWGATSIGSPTSATSVRGRDAVTLLLVLTTASLLSQIWPSSVAAASDTPSLGDRLVSVSGTARPVASASDDSASGPQSPVRNASGSGAGRLSRRDTPTAIGAGAGAATLNTSLTASKEEITAPLNLNGNNFPMKPRTGEAMTNTDPLQLLYPDVKPKLEVKTPSPKLDVELVLVTAKQPREVGSTQPSATAKTTTISSASPVTPDITSTAASNEYLPRPIVPKCCPLGQRILAEKKKCVDSPLEFIPPFLEFESDLPTGFLGANFQDGEHPGTGEPSLYEEDSETITTEAEGYDVIVGNPCLYGRFRLEPSVDSRDEFYLIPNGSLVAPFLFDDPLGPDGFCMDVFPDTTTGDVVVLPLVCFPPQEGNRRTGLQFVLYPIGLLCSVPFLVTTLVLYAMTPSLRDVQGKALMCHVMCLTVAYTSLATVQLWGSTLSSSLCFTIACFVQFSFVACFLWLNVMCINTWWNVSFRRAAPVQEQWCRRTERRRFVLYSMYAWALPCLLMGVTLFMDLTPTIPSSYLKPRFGIDTCWFQTDRAAIPYFYGPVTALIVFNTVLFVLTVVSLHRRHRQGKESSSLPLTETETCFQRHTVSASCFLLFGAMGINWIMEVISFYVGGPYYIWYATDILNCLQGLNIFIIFFVANRPARREVRARIAELRARRRNAGAAGAPRVRSTPHIDDFRTRSVVQRDSRGFQWHPVPTRTDE